ncbi:MAG: BrnT family toxin [Deltaproteobacteria bacterium]|nr:BrnT family toxin [Deltaproteobacteria bacterium]
MYIQKEKIEADERKARANFFKHGITFQEAETCFDDPCILMRHDVPHSVGEDRYIAIAKSSMGRVLMMVFTVRRDRDGQKIYRIISARHANQKERENYPR